MTVFEELKERGLLAQLTDEVSDLCDEMHFARNSAMKIANMEEKSKSFF